MIVLYINNEHCTSIAQLKGYFAGPLSTDSSIFYDLLECGRYGDIAQWLLEIGEDSMANRVESINSALSDSEYINQLGQAITGEIVEICTKPTFANCVNVSISKKESKYDSFIIELSFIVLVAVNEKYEVKLETGWGTKGVMLNPSEFEESKVFQTSFSFHKRPGKDIKEIIISVDGSQLFSETIDKSVKTTASPHLPIVDDIYSTKKEVLSSVIQALASRFVEKVEEEMRVIGDEEEKEEEMNFWQSLEKQIKRERKRRGNAFEEAFGKI